MLGNLLPDPFHYRPGDHIRVVSGSYSLCEGYVQSVNPRAKAIKAVIVVLGKETSVDLKPSQVRKLMP